MEKKKMNFTIIKSKIIENRVFLVILLLGVILRLINLYQYPFVFIDENVYVARAWSFLRYGWIDVYPLFSEYDHPYFGWILIGILSSLFNTELYYESARIAMVLIWCVQTIVIYQICRKISNKTAGLFACFLYSITVEYISLSRIVMIDNIALLFLLIAILTFEIDKRYWISAVFIGIASICKYTYLIFAIGFYLYYLIIKFKNNKEKISIDAKNKQKFIFIKDFIAFCLKWSIIALVIFMVWPILALIRGEFFPDGIHQSMLVRFIGQITDRGFIPFWEYDSYFNQNLLYFMKRNVFLLLVPLICVICSIIIMILRKKEFRRQIYFFIPLVLITPYLFFLMRGGIVYYFYFIPLFPLNSIIVAYTITIIKENRGIWTRKKNKIMDSRKEGYSKFTLGIIITSILFIGIFPFDFHFLYQQDNSHLQVMYNWVSTNIPKTAVCGSSGELLPELREIGFQHIYIYYRCTSLDHLFNSTILFGDWKNIDYFILNRIAPNVLNETFFMNENILRTAFLNSEVVQVFGSDLNQITVYKVNNL